MIERTATVLVLSAVLLIPRGGRAQATSTVQAGSLFTSSSDVSGVPSSILRVAPTFQYLSPNASFVAGTSAWLMGQQWQLADGAVSGTVTSPTVYGVRTQLLGNVSRAFEDQSLGGNQVDVETRISVPIQPGSGVWVGGGVARPWKISALSVVDLTDGGAWTRIGNATVSATLTNQRFTKAAQADSAGGISACVAAPASDAGLGIPTTYGSDAGVTSCSHGSSIRDLESAVHWQFARLELAGTAGYRFGDAVDVDPDSRRWGTATATLWVSPRLAIVAGGGRQPADIERSLPARTFGTVGMQVAYAPSSRNSVPVGSDRVVAVRAFDIHAAEDGMQKITIRVGGVEQVDNVGDFSDWEPLTLIRRGRDTWELLVPVEAGVHKINVRVDNGPWFAPPGLPTMRDGFGGVVGMLVVVKDGR